MAEPEIVLDLSRLLDRVFHPTPTGVDRCEMAYARGMLREAPNRLTFAAVHPFGIHGQLRLQAVHRFLDQTERKWEQQGFVSITEMRRFGIGALLSLIPRPWKVRSKGSRFYVLASPSNLTDRRLVSAVLSRQNARLVCLVHDLIPLEYPEYARSDGAIKHAQRIETIFELADGIIANSQATLTALQPYLASTSRSPVTAVAHLGTEPRAINIPTGEGRTYFVCVGTIEPRKNHLLLLNLWRQLSEKFGPANIPKLLIIGRRGWENEQVVDMLERCTALEGCVEELRGLPDNEVHRLLAGSRGLLLPSFAEGYGMPVAEALAVGIPVVCSDLPALREAGGNVPLYLDPLDGPSWRAAILDLSSDTSILRRGHSARLGEWSPTSWSSHLAIVNDLMHKLAS